MKFRKEIEADILALAKRATKGGRNYRIYKKLFSRLNDTQFAELWEAIKKSEYIPLFLDNYDMNESVDYDSICKLAKEWDIPLEQRIIIKDPDNGLVHMTNETVVVGRDYTRKQRQIIAKKFGAAKNDFDVEDLTGQAMGDSRAGGISNPETNVLLSYGLVNMAKELNGVLGGDRGAYRAFKNDIITTGSSSVKSALERGDGPKSLKTTRFLLRAMDIDNNFGER